MYKIGITTYDNDAMLFETHIGTEGGDLAYSAWGKTEEESTHKAEFLISIFNICIVPS